jgi:hypothetical protein
MLGFLYVQSPRESVFLVPLVETERDLSKMAVTMDGI